VLEPDPELAVEYGLFSVRQARAAGFNRADIERHVRRGSWNRRARGVLEVSGRAAEPHDELLLAVLAAGQGAVVGFHSAAHVLGWDLPQPIRYPQLILPPTVTSGRGYRCDLQTEDVLLLGVLPITVPAQTALDIAATDDFESAVIILDSALRSKQVTVRKLRARFRSSSRHGVVAARHALASADPASGSVAESEARLLFARAGLPAPVSQFVVRAGGRFVARVDFTWDAARLVVEIDGFQYHSAAGDFQRDRTRQNAVQLEGWLVLRFTLADIRNNQDLVVAQIRRALCRPLTQA
jgi:Protein of unknown function (DUF559)